MTTTKRPDRRRLLGALVLAPAGLGVATLLAKGRPALATLRPPGSGSSTTRCAACGQTGHTMLDPACPAAREVT